VSGPNAGFVGVGCPFVDVVGPGSDAALVVAEAGFDVVGEQGGVACGAFFGAGDGGVAGDVGGHAAVSGVRAWVPRAPIESGTSASGLDQVVYLVVTGVLGRLFGR
jgi:hypothetical protein